MSQGRNVAVPRGIVHALEVARALVPTETKKGSCRLRRGKEGIQGRATPGSCMSEDVERGGSDTWDVTNPPEIQKDHQALRSDARQVGGHILASVSTAYGSPAPTPAQPLPKTT